MGFGGKGGGSLPLTVLLLGFFDKIGGGESNDVAAFVCVMCKIKITLGH